MPDRPLGGTPATPGGLPWRGLRGVFVAGKLVQRTWQDNDGVSTRSVPSDCDLGWWVGLRPKRQDRQEAVFEVGSCRTASQPTSGGPTSFGSKQASERGDPGHPRRTRPPVRHRRGRNELRRRFPGRRRSSRVTPLHPATFGAVLVWAGRDTDLGSDRGRTYGGRLDIHRSCHCDLASGCRNGQYGAKD